MFRRLSDKLCEMMGWQVGETIRVRLTFRGVQILAIEFVIEESA